MFIVAEVEFMVDERDPFEVGGNADTGAAAGEGGVVQMEL